jgi:hypothetical protein
VINLLHLYKNIPTCTKIGQELFKVLEFFMEANQEKKPPQQKLQINKEMYLKITTQKMCLTSEIRTCFLGIPYVEKTYHNGDILNPELHVH